MTLADVDLETAQTAAEEIAHADGRAWAVPCDVRQASSVDAAIAAAAERFGRLDALVTTAGGDTAEPPFEETEDELWKRLIDSSLTSVMRCIRAALPHLPKTGSGTNVATIGSVNGLAAFGS